MDLAMRIDFMFFQSHPRSVLLNVSNGDNGDGDDGCLHSMGACIHYSSSGDLLEPPTESYGSMISQSQIHTVLGVYSVTDAK